MSIMHVGFLEIRCPLHHGKMRRVVDAGTSACAERWPYLRLDCGCTWTRGLDDRWRTPTDHVVYGLSEQMVERYGEEAGPELAGKIAKMMSAHDCVDNLRVTEVGNIMEEARYRVRKENGCCGSFDKTIRVHGREFCVGFNHGH